MKASFRVLLIWCLSLRSLAGATFTVVNTSDSGAGSLRQAILDANANPGADAIAFDIPGTGLHTIAPSAALPAITEPIVIDGYTQPGSSPNTDPDGDDAILLVELDGTSVPGATTPGLDIHSGGTTVRGLTIDRFPGPGIQIVLAGGNLVEGCFIGTDSDGSAALGNGGDGILVIANDNTIGGAAASARNLISSNGLHGIDVRLGQTDNVIRGNFIGTNRTGTAALGNAANGILVDRSSTTTIGGGGAGEGNLVSGNTGNGIRIARSGTNLADANLVRGNRIGTDVSGAAPLGNGADGLALEGPTASVVGGIAPGDANTIAYNGNRGVLVFGADASGNTIRGNSIHENAALGIDILGTPGPDVNDSLDGDTGPNGRQNFPIVTSAVPTGGGTQIQGVLHSAPSTSYDLDFYSNGTCVPRPHDFLEAAVFLGTAAATTDAGGVAVFDIVVPVPIQPGERVTATATDPDGNTSELSQRMPYSSGPSSGDPAGGQHLTILGTDFLAGADVTIGGVAATSVIVAAIDKITADAPALPAGSINDIAVSNADGSAGTLEDAFVADFLDVPTPQQFHSFVTTLVANEITVGIGGGLYGVDQPTLRQQMAVFLLKGSHGLCYTPPPCTGTFPDVPCPSTFADWIEALAAEGITGGCGGGNYCPQNPVRRDQMAVFLLKASHGSDYTPPPCAGVFADVPCPSPFADWIEQLAAEQITGGCGGGNYCPLNPNTRGQMAVFIVKTFDLQ